MAFNYNNYASTNKNKINSLQKERDNISKNYNPTKDSAYMATVQDFTKRQNYNSESARARMNAAVGGSGSGTATATAIAQVNNDYSKRIADLVPKFKQAALDNIDTQLKYYTDKDNEQYDRYADGRNFKFSVYKDSRNFNFKQDQASKNLAYKVNKDKLATTAKKAKTNSAKANKAYLNKVKESGVRAKSAWTSGSSGVQKAFDYLKTQNLKNVDVFKIVNSLPKVDGKTASYYYRLYW